MSDTVELSEVSSERLEEVEESISLSGELSSTTYVIDVEPTADLEARLRLAPPGISVPRAREERQLPRRTPGPVAARALVEEHRNVARSVGKRPAVAAQERTERERQIFHHSEVEAAQSRRLLSLEETVMLRDRKISELQAQVDALREKKSDLARKVDFEQDVREQIDAEIQRFQGKAQVDLQTVRSNMQALHDKEVSVLQERLKEAEAKAIALQKRLESEEQAHQTLQLAHNRLRTELQSEITDKVDKDYRLLLQDCEGHKRRAALLEETLTLRDEKILELQSKVDSLREKKKDLTRKVELEQVSSTQEVRDQINAEIRRFQEKASTDLENVRSQMSALHQKEVTLLLDRVQTAEERANSLQTRLDTEEQAHQAHQLSFSRVRAELQNEITELTGNLKLKTFEIERAGFTMEEVSSSRQKLDLENTQLKKQMEVMRQEFYNLELQYKEGRASERAELMTLREQMKGYMTLEKDLDATIRNCAEAPTVDAQEALLIGTTLGSAPASAQRRIQQSLLLAQELQKKNREARVATLKLDEAEQEISRLKQDLEAARLESRAAQCSEPQVYLHTALRDQKGETNRLKRELRSCQQELDVAQQQAEKAQRAKLQVEEDLRKLLVQRQHLEELQTLIKVEESSRGSWNVGQDASPLRWVSPVFAPFLGYSNTCSPSSRRGPRSPSNSPRNRSSSPKPRKARGDTEDVVDPELPNAGLLVQASFSHDEDESSGVLLQHQL